MLVTALAFGTSGCDEPQEVVQTAPKGAPAAVRESLGESFAAFAEADRNAKPREIAPGDLPPASLTGQPIDF